MYGHAWRGEGTTSRKRTSVGATRRPNLIGPRPRLAHLQVYDNTADAATGEPVPDPVLVLEVVDSRTTFPDAHDAAVLRATPGWAKPLVEAAFRM